MFFVHNMIVTLIIDIGAPLTGHREQNSLRLPASSGGVGGFGVDGSLVLEASELVDESEDLPDCVALLNVCGVLSVVSSGSGV
jgi:hypothetical protein